MKRMGVRFLAVFIGLGVAWFWICDSAQAQSPELFAGKRIVMIIGENPGGGTDGIGRMFGATIVKYLPGRPTIIFQNMPGAGGVKAFNYTYVQAALDGLTVVTGGGNAFDPVQYKKDSVKYDPTKFNYIVGFSNPSSILLINKSAEIHLADSSAKKLAMAATDGTRSSEQMALWGAVALGWNFQMINGYPGTAAMLLALQRGEVDMAANNYAPAIKPAIEDGKISVLAQTGEFFNGKLSRSDEFPDIPMIREMVLGKLDGPSLKAYNLWEVRSEIGKWYALPPKTPERYVAAYRNAVSSAMNDEEFQAWAVKTGGGKIKDISAKDLLSMIEEMVNTSDDTVSYLDDLLKDSRK